MTERRLRFGFAVTLATLVNVGTAQAQQLLADDLSTEVGWEVIDLGGTSAPSNWMWGVTAPMNEAENPTLHQGSNISDGAAGTTLPRLGTLAVAGSLGWADVQVSVRFLPGDDDGVGLLFRYKDTDNFYRVDLDHQQQIARLVVRDGGTFRQLAEITGPGARYNLGVWNTLEVIAVDDSIAVRLNDVALFGDAIVDATHETGAVGLSTWAMDNVYFDSLSVRSVERVAAVEQIERVILYEGYLSVDDVAASVDTAMRFKLYDAGGNELWSEEHSGDDAVTMVGGVFSIVLGRTTSLQTYVYDADELFLGIELWDGSPDWFPLEGRERITPVMWANWATHAAPEDGAPDLSAGVVSVGGDLTANSLTVDALETHRVQVSSSVGDGNIQLTGGIDRAYNGLTSGDYIQINGSLSCDHLTFDGTNSLGIRRGPFVQTVLSISPSTITINRDSDFSPVLIIGGLHSDADCDGATVTCDGTTISGYLAVDDLGPAVEGGIALGGTQGAPQYSLAWEADDDLTAMFSYQSTSDYGTAGINWPSNDRPCWIGGVSHSSGDLPDRAGGDRVLSNRTQLQSGTGSVYTDILSLGGFEETHSVVVICLDQDLNVDTSELDDWSYIQ